MFHAITALGVARLAITIVAFVDYAHTKFRFAHWYFPNFFRNSFKLAWLHSKESGELCKSLNAKKRIVNNTNVVRYSSFL